ncbi:MAG: caspase family protein, partial [Chloroflexi bacterium]|nr:caspase family protein [Chloroflexota bacterium]
MPATPTLYALIIGIDQYDPRSRIPNLRGCVTDADSIESVLTHQFGVPSTQILKLTNEQATHDAIQQAFRTHLIANAQKWRQTDAGNASPEFIFHYSGHGSQARDETGTEPDGMDETLVAHNSRLPGIFDIKDWELGQWIEELNQFTDHVTIILDCCHSGSGTRDGHPAIAQTRRCAPDLRPQATHRPPSQPSRRSVSASAWDVSGKHVLLAGCRDKEESNEYPVANGAQRYWQGAMTFFLVQELVQMQPERPLSYRELHERVRSQVNTAYASQMPQCEGDLDREVFSAVRPQRDVFFNIVDKRAGLIWIDGGLVHGLTEGSQLKVYAPETRTLDQAGAPLATLEVTEEGAVQSGCQTVEAGINLPLHARCTVERINHGNMQRTVLLAIDDQALSTTVQNRLGPQTNATGNDIARYVKVVDGSAADFRIAARDGQLEIQDNSGQRLVAPFKVDDLEGLAADLAHLVRYRNALAVRNDAASDLAGQVTLAIKKLAFDPNTQAPITGELDKNPGGEVITEVGERVVFEITNQSQQPLYFALFDFGPDYEVFQLYPTIQGAHEPLAAGHIFRLGLSAKKSEQFSAQLPADVAEGKDIFKLIATRTDTNFEVLQQGPLKSPFATRSIAGARGQAPSALDSLLTQAINGGNQRAFGPPTASVADAWTTAEVTVLTVQTIADSSRQLTGGVRTTLPTYLLAFEAPVGFNGQVRALTARQSTRAANGDNTDLQLPPGLAACGDWFQPLTLGATRAATPGGAVIEIEADEAARQLITPTTPLNVHLNWALDSNTAGVLALAYDGNFFYPVGRPHGDRQTLQIEWLPAPDAPAITPLRSTRSIGRIVKLYLYKLVGQAEPSLGLHQVRFVPSEQQNAEAPAAEDLSYSVAGGEVRYTAVTRQELKPHARIALAVHGFSAETSDMAAWLTSILPAHGVHYDHVLAFNYESFNTPI